MAKVDYVKEVQDLGIDALKSGIVGGLAVGVGSRLLGRTVGSALGGILAGAFLKGTDGRIVAINSIQDAVILALM